MRIVEGRAPVRPKGAAPRRATAFWKRKKFLIVFVVLALALGYLIMVAIQNSAMYYLSVDELLAKGQETVGQRVRLGGKVAEGSVHAVPTGTTLHFEATDGQKKVPITYNGVVPDAFKPGGDVVVEGVLTAEGAFNADVLLAKCPSKYVPSF